MATASRVPVSSITTEQFEPFVSGGQAFGEVHWLRNTSGGEGMLLTGLWKHPPATFDYVFPGDETFHVLEGSVKIQVEPGQSIELHPGDIVSFSKGQSSTWTIRTPFKKFFVISG